MNLNYYLMRWYWMHTCVRCCRFMLHNQGQHYMCRKCYKLTGV